MLQFQYSIDLQYILICNSEMQNIVFLVQIYIRMLLKTK